MVNVTMGHKSSFYMYGCNSKNTDLNAQVKYEGQPQNIPECYVIEIKISKLKDMKLGIALFHLAF